MQAVASSRVAAQSPRHGYKKSRSRVGMSTQHPEERRAAAAPGIYEQYDTKIEAN